VTADTLLQTRALSVAYPAAHGTVAAVQSVDLDVRAGEFLGIVGESGSGKTQLLLAMLGLNAAQARLSGSIRYRGQELLGLRPAEFNAIRGARIGMIFQDPMTALNPYLTVGRQITEMLQVHRRLDARAAGRRALEMLEAVHIPEAQRRLRQFPHELSGGMRQRVMIAMALVTEPDVILADEPTTALDVTVQAQILSVLRELRERTHAAIVLVTHDLGVIAEVADRVAVMYAGSVVEEAGVRELFAHPRHPYTEALHRAIPRLDGPLPARLPSIGGSPPDPSALPVGCPFAPRCPYRMAICTQATPALLPVAPGHRKACHYTGALGRLAAGGEDGQ
jgi:oligopeptide/dipeptide ABC transporter ATP-binding protein